MKLEDQVCSLYLAKRLKEFGVMQESLFEYINDTVGGEINYLTTSGKFRDANSRVSAFTVAELGEMLPEKIIFEHYPKADEWWVRRDEFLLINRHATYARTESDARAKMLIYLLEKNLITK